MLIYRNAEGLHGQRKFYNVAEQKESLLHIKEPETMYKNAKNKCYKYIRIASVRSC